MVTHQLIPWENTVHAQVPSFKFQMDFEKWIFRDLGMNRRLEMHEMKVVLSSIIKYYNLYYIFIYNINYNILREVFGDY